MTEKMGQTREYENYVFDLYGTLVDIHTEEGSKTLWEKLSLFYGYYDAHYTPEELEQRFRELIGNREAALKEQLLAEGNSVNQKKDDTHEAFPEIKIEDVFEALYREKGVEAGKELSIHTGQFFRVLSTDYVRLYEGVYDLLKGLKEAGKKVYLLSNAQRIFTEYELHAFDIAKYFDDILISSEYQVKKPDIRFFEILKEKHQLDPAETIMIGNDAVSDIAGAKNAGFATFYLHSNISPELPVVRKVEADGTVIEELQMPEADFALMELDLKKAAKMLGIETEQ